MLASFVTTFFMSTFEEPSYTSYSSFFYVSPLTIAQDLITAALRILKDEDPIGLFDEGMNGKISYGRTSVPSFVPNEAKPPGLLMRFIRRFVLGLPMVGAGSLVHMLLSVPFLGPLHWLARQRGGGRRQRNQSRDVAALVIVALLVVGAARFVFPRVKLISSYVLGIRALYKVYRLTESTVKRMLLKAEDAILEVG